MITVEWRAQTLKTFSVTRHWISIVSSECRSRSHGTQSVRCSFSHVCQTMFKETGSSTNPLSDMRLWEAFIVWTSKVMKTPFHRVRVSSRSRRVIAWRRYCKSPLHWSVVCSAFLSYSRQPDLIVVSNRQFTYSYSYVLYCMQGYACYKHAPPVPRFQDWCLRLSGEWGPLTLVPGSNRSLLSKSRTVVWEFDDWRIHELAGYDQLWALFCLPQ